MKIWRVSRSLSSGGGGAKYWEHCDVLAYCSPLAFILFLKEINKQSKTIIKDNNFPNKKTPHP